MDINSILDAENCTRRKVLLGMGTGAAAVVMGTLPGKAFAAVKSAASQDIGDGDILTFALNLEYLEAEFYAMATTGKSLGSGDCEGMGTGGATTGGKMVSFTNKELGEVAREIARDELDHVRLLRKALGRGAVAKPAINLDALGIGFKNEAEFIALARAFEDVGVSAYRGAAKLISNKDYLDTAAGILATEAYHAGNIRAHAVYGNYSSPKLDAIDQPPTANNSFPTDSNGVVRGRSVAEVGAIVRGKDMMGGAFFPKGLNGKIR